MCVCVFMCDGACAKGADLPTLSNLLGVQDAGVQLAHIARVPNQGFLSLHARAVCESDL